MKVLLNIISTDIPAYLCPKSPLNNPLGSPCFMSSLNHQGSGAPLYLWCCQVFCSLRCFLCSTCQWNQKIFKSRRQPRKWINAMQLVPWNECNCRSLALCMVINLGMDWVVSGLVFTIIAVESDY